MDRLSTAALEMDWGHHERTAQRPVPMEELNIATPSDFVSTFISVAQVPWWIAERVSTGRPFLSSQALLGAVANALFCAPEEDQVALLCQPPSYVRTSQLPPQPFVAGKRRQPGVEAPGRLETSVQELRLRYLKTFGFPFIAATEQKEGPAAIRARLLLRLSNTRSAEIELAIHELVKGMHFCLCMRLDDQARTGTYHS